MFEKSIEKVIDLWGFGHSDIENSTIEGQPLYGVKVDGITYKKRPRPRGTLHPCTEPGCSNMVLRVENRRKLKCWDCKQKRMKEYYETYKRKK